MDRDERPALSVVADESLLTVVPGQALVQTVAWTPDQWRVSTGPLGQRRAIVDELAEENPAYIGRSQLSARADGLVIDLLIATMIWGFGPRGYGPSRVQRMLAAPRSGESLEAELDYIRTEARESASKGFLALYHQEGQFQGRTRIHWLGTAFGTKFLYAAATGRMKGDGPEPLVYDALVSRALKEVSDLRISSANEFLTGCDYERYCAWAVETASSRGAVGADVEHALFELGRRLRPRHR